MNNRIHIQTKILVRSMIRKLTICLELANKIDDQESGLIVSKIVAQKRNVKNVLDNIARENIWLNLFYIGEILEAALLVGCWICFAIKSSLIRA